MPTAVVKRVLITGFEPFGGESENPSSEIARAIDGHLIDGRAVVGRVLPCEFGRSLAVLRAALRELSPELVLCLGQAGGRAAITVERVAINVDDARIADNVGAAPVDEPIVRRGPAAYWSTLPIKAMVAALREQGLPAEVSQTAGTFVCNHVFYGLMHMLARKKGVRGGFIHVPFSPAQAARASTPAPSLPLAEQQRGIALAIRTAIATRRDLRRAGGATH